MSYPRLSTRIREHGLSDPVAKTFRNELLKVAQIHAPMQDTESALIDRLAQPGALRPGQSAPIEALWPCAELLIEACVTVAVTEDGYTVDKARHISQLAHSLGYSARQLSQLEDSVIGALVLRSR